MSTLKQTKTMTGSTNSSLWTWKHIVYEYFDDDYITTNKSKIVVESYLGRPSGQSTQSFGGTASINITCNGDSRTTSRTWNYGANHIAGGGWFCIQSETFYVEHSADGTKSISVSSSLSTSDFNPHSASASGNITLTTIPRATACPNIDGYIEGSASISLLPASTTFKHRIYYSYNGKTGYYPSSSGFFSNTGSLPLDTSFYPYSPKSSNTGSITLYTYDSSGNLIGSKTGEITIRCDKEKCKPVISISVVDSNPTTTALTGNSSKLVKGYSNAKITYTITTRNSASLKSKTLNGGSLGNSPYTISNISINSFSILAIDSRDFDTTETKTSTMVDYVPLTLDFEAYRPTPTGSEIKINFQGNYFDSSFGAVANSLSLSWKYRKKGDSDWKDGGPFEINTDYKVNNNRYYSISDISLGTMFDYQTNYEVCVLYEDKLISTSITKTIPKGEPIISWEDGLVKANGRFMSSKFNYYYLGIVDKKWVEIGKFTFDGQGTYACIDCYFGEGQNGSPDQNTHARILLKQGWTGESFPIGVTTKFTQNYKSNFKVKILHTSLTECKLYVYLPFSYSDFTYVYNGSYKSFVPSNITLSSEPSTDTESTYYKDIEVLNSNNTSSINTYSCNYINEIVKEKYSTSEQVIGTWIDGKKIYRKVNELNSVLNNGDNIYNTGITNLESLIDSRLYFKYSDRWYANWDCLFNKTYMNNGSQYVVNSSSQLSVQKMYLITDYTKTTN